MTWAVQFFNERLGLTVSCQVDAPGPAAAVSAAARALEATYPRDAKQRRRSLFQRAQAASAADNGWVPYRIRRIPDQVAAVSADVGS